LKWFPRHWHDILEVVPEALA